MFNADVCRSDRSCCAWCREDWIRAIQSVAERLQVLDDFDGQFSDDVSKLSKLKKKVVSKCRGASADAVDAVSH